MKARTWLAPVAIALAACAGASLAVPISNLHGQSCGNFIGTWHFVNNQVPPGSGEGTLHATFSSGNTCTVDASKVLRSVQHFYCTGAGTLTSASTNLGGRLVLSDFTCTSKEPPCDPKKENCEPPCDPKKEDCKNY